MKLRSRSVEHALVVGLFTLALLVTPAEAHEQGAVFSEGLLYHHCHEVLGFQDVPLEALDGFVPRRYGWDHDVNGVATFYISTRLCERITVNGIDVHDTIDSHISVFIIPPGDEPAPPHASSLVPGVPLDVYLIQWVTDSQAHATWMKQSTGLGEKVKLVPDLVFHYEPKPGHVPGASDPRFRIVVPRPAPSPFSVAAEVHEHGACVTVQSRDNSCATPSFIAENWWADTEEGTVIIHAESPKGASISTPALVTGTITAHVPDSFLGQMFDDRQTRPFCSDSTGNPGATCLVGDPIGSGFFTAVQLTKCVRKVTSDCRPDDH